MQREVVQGQAALGKGCDAQNHCNLKEIEPGSQEPPEGYSSARMVGINYFLKKLLKLVNVTVIPGN